MFTEKTLNEIIFFDLNLSITEQHVDSPKLKISDQNWKKKKHQNRSLTLQKILIFDTFKWRTNLLQSKEPHLDLFCLGIGGHPSLGERLHCTLKIHALLINYSSITSAIVMENSNRCQRRFSADRIQSPTSVLILIHITQSRFHHTFHITNQLFNSSPKFSLNQVVS